MDSNSLPFKSFQQQSSCLKQIDNLKSLTDQNEIVLLQSKHNALNKVMPLHTLQYETSRTNFSSLQ